MAQFYLVASVLGLVLPYTALVTWVVNTESFSFGVLWNALVANGLSAMAWVDVVITAIVLIAFIRVEGRRMNVPNLLAPILGTYLVGPSFGLPLFLYFREKFRIASLEAS